MIKDNNIESEVLPPHVQLIQMGNAFQMSRLIYTAAKLNLADHLSEGPRNVTELADLTSAQAPLLYRFMRALTDLGIFLEGNHQHFSLTPLGEALKAGAPGSAHSTIMVTAGILSWRTWEFFPQCLEDGDTGVQKAWGMPIFELLAQHPQEASYFNEAMIGLHGSESLAITTAYDFSGSNIIVDIGGGTGNILSTILGHYSEPQAILFDLPSVIDEAIPLIQAQGLTDRITAQSGNFFESVPEGGDTYILSHIIHDWNEEQCLTILGNCHKAMKSGSKLLIIEMVLPTDGTPHPGKLLDMTMLAYTGGQERTEQEYASLLEKADFRLTRVVPTESPVSIVKASPA